MTLRYRGPSGRFVSKRSAAQYRGRAITEVTAGPRNRVVQRIGRYIRTETDLPPRYVPLPPPPAPPMVSAPPVISPPTDESDVGFLPEPIPTDYETLFDEEYGELFDVDLDYLDDWGDLDDEDFYEGGK